MTNWTDAPQVETGWESPQDPQVGTVYNSELAYNNIYSYNGYYVAGNTPWSNPSTVETAWKD